MIFVIYINVSFLLVYNTNVANTLVMAAFIIITRERLLNCVTLSLVNIYLSSGQSSVLRRGNSLQLSMERITIEL